MAAAGCATMAWLGLAGFAWTGYELEAQPAFRALIAGHLVQFLRLAPAYGGSLVERAPFALLPGLWGGGELSVYRMVAVPGLLASASLGIYLVARMRAHGATRLARAVALGVCVANPLTLAAFELGHSEELLSACLCVAAVLLAASPSASRERVLWAGITLGLAIANKETAVLAAGPVLAVLPARRRPLCLLVTTVCAGAVLAPLALVSSGGFLAGARSVASTSGPVFQPQQLWWFFGSHGHAVHGLFDSPKPGYRVGPAWASPLSHPLIIAVGAALAAALWLRSRRSERRGAGPLALRDALCALALVMLLRCVLDTWDSSYYMLPFLLALLALESSAQRPGPPLLALLCSALAWWSFEWLPAHVSADAQAALFLAWTLPLAGWLAWRLFSPGHSRGAATGTLRPPEDAQPMTVRALGRPVRTS